MTIKFRNLVLEGFMSFGLSELKLDNPGYILVSGHNKNPADAALSNGSGKSSIFNAIAWALTGETISGLKGDDVVNIHTNTGCKVELTFEVDGNVYKITRYRKYPKHGNDLTIFVNDKDKSGTTLTASEKVLNELLPDLTSNLISSVILLGQGLPHKFSDNSPAGRKELLEKLSKSDFMINDIKSRLVKREIELNEAKRIKEDAILKATTESSLHASNLTQARLDLTSLEHHPDYEAEIQKVRESLSNYNKQITELKEVVSAQTSIVDKSDKQIADIYKHISELTNTLTGIQNKYKLYNDNVAKSHNDYQTKLLEQRSELTAERRTNQNEIDRIKNIKDVCPVCGHKLEGVSKPSSEVYEKKVVELDKQLGDVETLISEDNKAFTEAKNKSDEKLEAESKETKDLIADANKAISNINVTKDAATKSIRETQVKIDTIINTDIRKCENDIAALESARDNYLKNKEAAEKLIKDLEAKIKTAEDTISYNNKEKSTLENHLVINSKLMTLIKRDFRGILLTNVIEFIEAKLKEYCSLVFDTDNINFKLNGNNIDIIFCDKPLEALSGGEQQKVNICIQLALRDMLCQYLDFSSNILAIDEVFDQLDVNGCTRVLNLISSKLTDVESIYIISHHTDLSCPSDLEIIVEKDESGVSRIR